MGHIITDMLISTKERESGAQKQEPADDARLQQVSFNGHVYTVREMPRAESLATLNANPLASWNGLQPILWRAAAFQKREFAEQVIKEGLAEYQEFATRFGIEEPGLQPGVPRFSPATALFSFQRHWSEETRRLWQHSFQPDSKVTLVPGSSGAFMRIPPHSDATHTIWTYNLGGCSTLLLAYQLPDQ